MRSKTACPDGPTLQRFLLGQTPEVASAIVEEHLEQCASCSAALETLQASDSVVDAIRAHLGAAGDTGTAAVRQLTDRLKEFRPTDCVPAGMLERDATLSRALNADAASRTDAQPESDATASDAGSDRTEGRYDFLAPAKHPQELGRLGHYQVRKVLGTGGMGVVFEAYDPQLDRLVALKAMLPALATRTSAKQRFLREAKAVAALKHDHIVTIYQVDEDRGTPFLAMELLEGESLSEKLRREGLLSVPEIIRIARETALALAAAHKRDLIHRDVKPGNIFLETKPLPLRLADAPSGPAQDFRVKLLDFGLARPAIADGQLTQAGAILGTPAFMAPEQFRGQPVDFRCDLFSLGCVLYQMATGEQPFKGADAIATGVAVTTEAARPPREINPDLPPELCDLVMRLLAKNPDERPRSAVAVIEAIEAIESGRAPLAEDRAVAAVRPVVAVGATVARPFTRRMRAPIAAAILLGLLASGAYLFGPTIVRFIFNEGELIIEIDDPKIKAVIGYADLTIRDLARHKEYTIKPTHMPAAKDLPAGEHVLEVTEADGDARVFTKEFTIRRGGKNSVRVTFDPKLLEPKTVSGIGKEPTHLFADPAHDLDDVLDFRDLTGASLKELRVWADGLGPDFHLTHISNRRGTGAQMFNAVAVREKKPHLYRFLAESEPDGTWDRQWDDGFRPVVICPYLKTEPKAEWTEARLFVKDGVGRYFWYGSLENIRDRAEKLKPDGSRVTYLDAPHPPHAAGSGFRSILPDDQGRKWDTEYALNAEQLLSTVELYWRRGWRPDVVAPYWDRSQLRFMLVAVDNSDQVDWRFRMDMSPAQYKKESAEQKANGLFPLALASYGHDAKVRYTAIWVRFRAPGDPAPEPAAPDPQALADRVAKAVSWASAAKPTKVYADKAHSLANVLDYRDVAGASLKELRDWTATLGPEFHVSSITNRRGTGMPVFNAVAVREKDPLPFRFFPEVTNEKNGANWEQQEKDGFRPAAICAYLQANHEGRTTDALLWVKDGTTPYNLGGDWKTVRKFLYDRTVENTTRPAYLDGLAKLDLYRCVLPVHDGRKWESLYGVDADELLATVEFYQRKGWRPDVLAPHWKDDQLRFMLVAVDNSDQVDWRFRMDMPLAAYRQEAAQQKQQGLFPLALASYGNEADIRYAAIFVRFRDEVKK